MASNEHISAYGLNPLKTGNPQTDTFANSEDGIYSGYALFATTKSIFKQRSTVFFLEIISCNPSIYTANHHNLIVSVSNGPIP